MPNRILFLIADTGGGHRASAQAICEAIEHLYPGEFETSIEDIWIDHTRWPINRLPNAYPWLSTSGTRWWMLVWQLSARPRLRSSVFGTFNLMVQQRIVRLLQKLQPDLVVSVHPGFNHLGVKWMRRAKLDAPFFTVVSDMVTVHPTWICPEVTGCIVSTPPARDQAIAHGMPPEKITVCGQPVSPKFAHLEGDKEALRRQLGLAESRPVVLVVGGGEGVGRVYEIARAVARSADRAQLVVVAGRNKKLRQQLKAVAWEIPTQVHGFVKNMPEFMGAADILVTKAGPGTISEAFIAGLPVIISGYVPGQEEGNVRYVRDNEAGAFAEDPDEIARLVQAWLEPGNETLQRMMANAARLAQPEAALKIARVLCAQVERGQRETAV